LSDFENQLDQIKDALADLRASASGAETRKQLDSLFRRVHSLKATATADGLSDLSHAAHELENVLHALRTGEATLDGELLQQLTTALSDNLLPREIWNSLKAEERHATRQSVKEGANLFLVQTRFDVADFDRQFQKLIERLTSTGEVLSTSPQAEGEKINFRLLYSRAAETGEVIEAIADINEVYVEPLLMQTANSFDSVLQRTVRAGQAAALALGKKVDFEVRGANLSLAKPLCDALAAPLIHLVRNAVDHGIEACGKITVEAKTSGDQLMITVADDGRGIDPSLIPLISRPGFSTKNEVSETSGRGVGLDVVKTTVEELGGSMKIKSELGRGSTFEISVPLKSV
jgi:two-component system chemotaxis sensor kinase CheA